MRRKRSVFVIFVIFVIFGGFVVFANGPPAVVSELPANLADDS